MVTLALIGVGIVSLLVFILFGALVEMYRDIRQLRDAAGILDRPMNVEIKAIVGTAPSKYGLPEALDSVPTALLLFFTEKCLTCRVLASTLDKSLPAGVWVLAQARDTETAENFRNITKMVVDDRVISDIGGRISDQLGISIAPVGFRIEKGRFVSATTVPSTRYLSSILPAPLQSNPMN